MDALQLAVPVIFFLKLNRLMKKFLDFGKRHQIQGGFMIRNNILL